MSDGGASGGFDSGSSGGGFDSGSFGGGGFDSGSPSFDPGATGGIDPHGMHGVHGMHGADSPLWMHEQQMRHHRSRRSGGSLPTSPVGIVLFVVVAIIALVVFSNIASRSTEVYPGVPSSEVFDGGSGDVPFDLPEEP
ncbi:hypothetical protein KMZ32_04450 [Phycicoccus sp. MAQZ13P-2]|uniref:hypothetical protein n=1 Tax=Phycicoccus mangrovi TaxID=2840470 RepID=UPI001C004BD4|nr:hypothetical protein [Phycicoccus mangrovi]MBT9254472.1 hypothetical protein [Phycicoccus mangrovi]MBT9273323.1 hypothetical protein [Phycicoccus mangrovi]